MFGALAVGRTVAAPAAARRANDQRHRHVTEHAGKLHGVVVDLVHAQGEEVGEHHLGHRFETRKRQADRGAGDAGLADRCGDHPPGEIGR